MEATLSYFGRVNYDYKGKYIVSVSMRADGSSRFAEDNKWGFFPEYQLDGICIGKISSSH